MLTAVSAGRDITVEARTTQFIQADRLYLSRPEVPQRPFRLAPRPVHLAGREDLLAKVRERLTASGPTPRLLALHGLGGVGKTSIATEFAHRYAGGYGLVWQLPAEDRAVLAGAYAELAAILGVRDPGDTADPIGRVHAALAARSDRWLLLLDNVTDAKALTGALPPAGFGHVLITTRSAYWPPDIGVEVPVLDHQAAVVYLLARVAPDPPSGADAVAAAEVATELGGLPLALEQVAAYLRETSRTLPQYRVLLGQRRAELLARGQPWGYASRVASTWDLSFDALRTSAPDAVSLLRLASCLAPEAIPLGMLLGTGQRLEAELRDAGVAASLAPLMLDTFAVDDARRALGDYSLARGAPGDMLTVHRLVQAVTLERLDDGARNGWREAAAALVEAALPADPEIPDTWESFALLLPHALATFDPGRPGLGALLSYLDVSGDYQTARDVQQKVVADTIARHGERDAETLEARANLAVWTGLSGDPIAARDMLARLHAIRAEVSGPEHLRTLVMAAKLADWTGQSGGWDAARDLCGRTLPLMRRVAGDRDKETIALWTDYGFWTGQAGDQAAACAIYEQVLPIMTEVLGVSHRETLAARDQYARFTGEAGDPARARALVADVIRDQEQAMGANHTGTLWVRASVAWWTGAAGDPAGAAELYRELLPARERLSGPRHPATLVVRGNLAYWTGMAGDAATARDQFKDLLPVQREVLGAEHPETLLGELNVAEWTGQAGDPCLARDLLTALLAVYKRIFGPDHAGTRRVAADLAQWADRC
jgi:NB-ARC domain/Tetratricopeptide repeat